MDNSGHICAAESPTGGQTEIATSAGSTSGPNGNGTYNNGSWHFVVASFSSSSDSRSTSTARQWDELRRDLWSELRRLVTIGYEYETGGACHRCLQALYLNGSLAEVAVSRPR